MITYLKLQTEALTGSIRIVYIHLLGIEFFDYNTGFAAGKYGGGKKTTNGGINWIQMGQWLLASMDQQ